MNTTVRLAFVALLCVGMIGCKRAAAPVTPGPVQEVERTVETQPAPVSDAYTVEDLERVDCLRQRVLYFDFDRSDVRNEFQQMLSCHGKYLRDRPSARITLEGHADERGSREYNLGLGERRGNTVSDMLRANGGNSGQLMVVSKGEEVPVCAESSESCWQRNRRVEIVYTAR